MKKYRVLAEYIQLFEIEVEATSATDAIEQAKNLDSYEFRVWDETGLSDGFEIISAEEV